MPEADDSDADDPDVDAPEDSDRTIKNILTRKNRDLLIEWPEEAACDRARTSRRMSQPELPRRSRAAGAVTHCRPRSNTAAAAKQCGRCDPLRPRRKEVDSEKKNRERHQRTEEKSWSVRRSSSLFRAHVPARQAMHAATVQGFRAAVPSETGFSVGLVRQCSWLGGALAKHVAGSFSPHSPNAVNVVGCFSPNPLF